MKNLVTIIVGLILLLTSLSVSGQTSSSIVIGIDHSDFVADIYPNMDRPAVILFGSNYCRNSLSQFKMLREKAPSYKSYVDFYSVNVDTNENFEWLEQLYNQEHLDALGTPTWVFYYAEEGYKYLYYAQAGGLYPADLSEIVEDMIERSKIGDDDDY